MENLNIDVNIFAKHIVNFINEINNDNNKKITHLKLQKLLYFSYVYALINWNKKLWNNNFERWDNGPVLSIIYNKYKKYKREEIPTFNENIKINNLTNTQKLELDCLLMELNNTYSTNKLVDLSHDFIWEKLIKNEKYSDEEIIKYYSNNNNNFFGDLGIKTEFDFNLESIAKCLN